MLWNLRGSQTSKISTMCIQEASRKSAGLPASGKPRAAHQHKQKLLVASFMLAHGTNSPTAVPERWVR